MNLPEDGRHREALTIFNKLLTDRSGYGYTPCNDKDIELALGRLYQKWDFIRRR